MDMISKSANPTTRKGLIESFAAAMTDEMLADMQIEANITNPAGTRASVKQIRRNMD